MANLVMPVLPQCKKMLDASVMQDHRRRKRRATRSSPQKTEVRRRELPQSPRETGPTMGSEDGGGERSPENLARAERVSASNPAPCQELAVLETRSNSPPEPPRPPGLAETLRNTRTRSWPRGSPRGQGPISCLRKGRRKGRRAGIGDPACTEDTHLSHFTVNFYRKSNAPSGECVLTRFTEPECRTAGAGLGWARGAGRDWRRDVRWGQSSDWRRWKSPRGGRRWPQDNGDALNVHLEMAKR